MFDVSLLIALSFVMGLVNSTSGGGGVIGVPALLLLGYPSVNALALNRFADIGNLIGSLKNYLSIPEFDLSTSLKIIPSFLIGAFIGALAITSIPEATRHTIILIAVTIGAIILIYPFKSKEYPKKSISIFWGILAFLALGLWDGAFAMAGGTLGVIILVIVFKKSYVGAKSILTFAAVPETLISVTILYFNSSLMIVDVICMIIGSALGGYLGSKIAIKRGSQFIRYTMVAMAFIMIFKLLVFDLF